MGFSIQHFLNSFPGQFLIGGLTVGGIGYFANELDNPAIAAVIAALPIGMPSSVFVSNNKVIGYSKNLMFMTFALIAATVQNWYLLSHVKMSKYKSVTLSMGTFVVLALIYTYFMK